MKNQNHKNRIKTLRKHVLVRVLTKYYGPGMPGGRRRSVTRSRSREIPLGIWDTTVSRTVPPDQVGDLPHLGDSEAIWADFFQVFLLKRGLYLALRSQ